MTDTFKIDRPFIENKYHNTSLPFNPHNRMGYHGWDCDPDTGLDTDEIMEGLEKLETGLPHPVAKANAVAYVLANTRIGINEHDYFFSVNTWNREISKTTVGKWNADIKEQTEPEIKKLRNALSKSWSVRIWADFDHVVPDWNSIIRLGFTGLRERARAYRIEHEKEKKLSARETAFFDGIEIEYTAIISFVDRLYRLALTKTHPKARQVAQCMRHLRDGAPQDIYEAMQLIFLYFMISESVDCYQVRSLGNGLDNTLFNFYENDLKSGRYTEAEIKTLFSYFFMQWSAIGNYWGQPFYLGGTDENGGTRFNKLSTLILDVYDSLGITNPKIQLKVNENTPDEILYKAFCAIRESRGNYAFCCEPGMIKAVMSYGATYEEARTMDIRGCYETGVRANEVSTAPAYVNSAKPVLYVLSRGYDSESGEQAGAVTVPPEEIKSFDDFYNAVLEQWRYQIESTVRIVDDFESKLSEINPSSMYSATVETSLKNARDGYMNGVRFNNTDILCCGFATMVDSLMAVKELVFDRQMLTLSELKTALDNNWKGFKGIRAAALKSKHKYGNGDTDADNCAASLAKWYTYTVNNRPNARGGVYKSIMHTALMFVLEGEHTGATPDGRLDGEEISKNGSPSVGADRNGVTALIGSALKLNPSSFIESFCLDLMLHPTAVSGDDGLVAMKALLMTYLKNGGMSVQMNVFSAETLIDAQKHPERYRNLQVRVCGWNVLWNDLSLKEQNAYILRACRENF